MFRGLKSLVAGVVAGTALGMLFAPKKGEELRKNFKTEINKGGTGFETLKEAASKMGKDIHEVVQDLADSECCKKGEKKLKKGTKEAVKRAKELYDEFVPNETKKQIKKGLATAKKEIKAAEKKARKTVKKVDKKITKSVKKATKKK
jgi:gas vesicle protein